MTIQETSQSQQNNGNANTQQGSTTPLGSQVPAKVDLRGLPLASVGGGGMFMPATLQDVVDFAGLMARSDFAVPPRFRLNPGACLAVAMQALRWEMDPYAVIQKAYVTNDRIAYEAQLVAAVVNTRAPIVGRISVEYEGEGEERRCTASALFRDETKPKIVRSPPIRQIAVKNSPLWKSDPDQQLAYYTMRSFARRHCPEVLMGVYTPDEAAGIGAMDITPASPLALAAEQFGAPKKPEQAETQDPPHDAVTGEIIADEDSALERAAAALWRAENPTMSVFNCDHEMKEKYRHRALEAANVTETPIGRGIRLLTSCKDAFDVADLRSTITDELAGEEIVIWEGLCAARASELFAKPAAKRKQLEAGAL